MIDPNLVNIAREFLLRDSFAKASKLQDTKKTLRETIEFGYDYGKLCDGDKGFVDFPETIASLRHELINQLRSATGVDLPKASLFTNGIASLYKPGYRLQPHVDIDPTFTKRKGKEIDFFFGPYIVGVILQSDKEGRLYLQNTDDKKPVYDELLATPLMEENGMGYLLQGDNRSKYPHGVSTVEKERISLTFRTVEFR